MPGLKLGAAISGWSNDFEADTSGWFTESAGYQYDSVTRVLSGTDGIPSAQGSYFAQVTDQPGRNRPVHAVARVFCSIFRERLHNIPGHIPQYRR